MAWHRRVAAVACDKSRSVSKTFNLLSQQSKEETRNRHPKGERLDDPGQVQVTKVNVSHQLEEETTMKRMKRIISTFACALAVLIWTCAPVPIMEVRGASTVNSVVYPSGVFPDDVLNVQAAVDLGGNVLLKATNAAGQPTAFNFGTPEALPDRQVLLTTDVSILGE
jgi:hypothetical protein